MRALTLPDGRSPRRMMCLMTVGSSSDLGSTLPVTTRHGLPCYLQCRSRFRRCHRWRCGFWPERPADDGAVYEARGGRALGRAAEGEVNEAWTHTGHASVAMVRVYTRRSDAFADHAGEGLL